MSGSQSIAETTRPPHPAFFRAKALQKAMGERDRLWQPDLPSAEEAEVLLELVKSLLNNATWWWDEAGPRQIDDAHFGERLKRYMTETLSLHGRSTQAKLAALRTAWWGWVKNNAYGGIHLGPIQPPGYWALVRYLREKAASGDAAAQSVVIKLCPTIEEQAAAHRERAEGRLQREADSRRHDLKTTCWSLTWQVQQGVIGHHEGRMLEIAKLLGQGANDVDGFLAELRERNRLIEAAKFRLTEIDAALKRVEDMPVTELLALGRKQYGGLDVPWLEELGDTSLLRLLNEAAPT